MHNDQQFIAELVDSTVLHNASFTWEAPSNIALIKYWGKTEPQLPKNASLSFTLSKSRTITEVTFNKKQNANGKTGVELYLDGEKKDSFKPKVVTFLERIIQYVPYIQSYDMIVHTKNTFPHSSGIASSASGMAALALCIMSLEKQLNPSITDEHFRQKSSFLARLGSGSASRSIEGPIVVWGKHNSIEQSNDHFAIALVEEIDPVFTSFKDSILLVDKGEKQVSSTVGHNLMQNHPFAQARFNQAKKNLSLLCIAMKNGDLNTFIEIVEKEALSLHALMMTSSPYFILMKPNTLSIIQRIWDFRAKTKLHLCFTLDAGANVHLLYPEKEADQVKAFILNELLSLCQNKQYICDNVGFGARQV